MKGSLIGIIAAAVSVTAAIITVIALKKHHNSCDDSCDCGCDSDCDCGFDDCGCDFDDCDVDDGDFDGFTCEDECDIDDFDDDRDIDNLVPDAADDEEEEENLDK
ncbi:MAG: hypothetical protein Q4F95_13875 [Oscillospiraceae bacterium]|nr:hypothetical protein [Oscillospiraceae bacterium]